MPLLSALLSRSSRPLSGCLLALITVQVCGPAVAGETTDGFLSLFDGATLAGWETPNPAYWSIEDGAITGRITREQPCSTNQYLVWTGGELADFELRLKSRLRGEGGINNGFQFRSRLLPDHDVCGFQMDNNLQTPWLVRLYDEYGRHTLAMRGEHTTFDADGGRTTRPIPEAQGNAWFRLEDWHEYHLVCRGTRLTLHVDGRLAAEVEDGDVRRHEPQGILALQLHSGPPTVVQFKDIRLRILKPAEPPRDATVVPLGAARPGLIQEAAGWWALDSGGHGARPGLQHIPGWEQFELNVLAAGPQARPQSKVVVLDGAYFETGPDFHGTRGPMTVFLRARDPRGTWDAALMNRGSGTEPAAFRLMAVDLPATPGPDLAFEVQTEKGSGRASFPVSDFEPLAWHDLVGRYDGRSVALFCDGVLKASTVCPGEGLMAPSSAPLRIAAELREGKMVRHFRGELQEAGVWSRALSDAEIAALSASR